MMFQRGAAAAKFSALAQFCAKQGNSIDMDDALQGQTSNGF